jgi:hypothetical protein
MDTVFRTLAREETDAAAWVLARGMAPLPLTLKALGDDTGDRIDLLRRMFAVRIAMSWCPPQCAAIDRRIAGVCLVVPPGCCRPSWVQAKRLELTLREQVPDMFVPAVRDRLAQWTRAWSDVDPVEHHWHIGPLSIAPEFQRRGLGTAIMSRVLANIDERHAAAYLETDHAGAVDFYLRLGFEVSAELSVLGLPTWLMWRTAR